MIGFVAVIILLVIILLILFKTFSAKKFYVTFADCPFSYETSNNFFAMNVLTAKPIKL